MNKLHLYFLPVITFLIVSCENTAVVPFMGNQYLLETKSKIIFNPNTQRFILTDDIYTKSTTLGKEITSLNRENFILDSLTADAEKKEISQKIIFLGEFPDDITSVSSQDDSSSIGLDFAIDTCDIPSFYTCGTLRNGHSSFIEANLGPEYRININGFCNYRVQGPIYTLNYSTFHNLVIETAEGYRAIYSGIYNPRYDICPVFLNGSIIMGPMKAIWLEYYNSETLNKDSIIWECNFEVDASIDIESYNI